MPSHHLGSLAAAQKGHSFLPGGLLIHCERQAALEVREEALVSRNELTFKHALRHEGHVLNPAFSLRGQQPLTEHPDNRAMLKSFFM